MKDCPTCHRPFEKRGMHCASCGRPIKKNHKWRIDHSTVRHQDCRNVRLVPLCQSRFSTQECVLELENHPTRHISVTGVTWSLDEHEFDNEGDVISNTPLLPAGAVGRTLLFGGVRGGGMNAMVAGMQATLRDVVEGNIPAGLEPKAIDLRFGAAIAITEEVDVEELRQRYPFVLDGLCTTGAYIGTVRADHNAPEIDLCAGAPLEIRRLDPEVYQEAIDTAENEGMILRERGE